MRMKIIFDWPDKDLKSRVAEYLVGQGFKGENGGFRYTHNFDDESAIIAATVRFIRNVRNEESRIEAEFPDGQTDLTLYFIPEILPEYNPQIQFS